MTYIEELIEKTITDKNLSRELVKFAKVALISNRGLQKDTGRREIIEVIVWFSHNLNKGVNFEEVLNMVYDHRPVVDYNPNVGLLQLKVEIDKMNGYDGAYHMKVVNQNDGVVQYLNKDNIFPYGITLAQLYMIDGVIENYLY